MSIRIPTIDIISIAQHASPNVSGKNELPRAHATALSTRRRHHLLLDVRLELLVGQIAAQHVARLELSDAEVRQRLALYFHSSAPRRHTYTNAIISSTTNTIVSDSAKVPNARSCTAIG